MKLVQNMNHFAALLLLPFILFVFNSCGGDPCDDFALDCVNGQCIENGSGNAICDCNSGWILDPQTGTCIVPLDPCSVFTTVCVNGQCAVNESGVAYCLCATGWAVDPITGKCTIQIPEICDDFTVDCVNGQCADDGTGNPICDCNEGWAIDPSSGACTSSVAEICENFTIDCINGQCADDGAGNPICDCNEGWAIDPSTGACTSSVAEICENFPIDCVNGQCADDGDGNPICDCNEGWAIDPSTGACTIEIQDPCEIVNCDGNSICINGICIDQCDGVTCPNNSTCSLENSQVVCLCNEGFEVVGEMCLPICGEGYEINADGSACELTNIAVLIEGRYAQTDENCTSNLTLNNYAAVEAAASGEAGVILLYNFADLYIQTEFDVNGIPDISGSDISLNTVPLALELGDDLSFDSFENSYSITFTFTEQIIEGVTITGGSSGIFKYFVDTDDASFVFNFTLAGTNFTDSCIGILNKVN